MTTSFDDAFTALIGNEGRYSFNPADPGGETMWGITIRVARANGYSGAMKDLPLATAKSIAKAQYWDKIRGDELEPHLAFQLFDTAYNGGHPVQWLQQAVGVITDGAFGNGTMAAVEAENYLKIIMRFDSYRITYLTSLSTWPSFGKGWMNRIAANLLKGAA